MDWTRVSCLEVMLTWAVLWQARLCVGLEVKEDPHEEASGRLVTGATPHRSSSFVRTRLYIGEGRAVIQTPAFWVVQRPLCKITPSPGSRYFKIMF